MTNLPGEDGDSRSLGNGVAERDQLADDSDQVADLHDIAAGERDRDAEGRDTLSEQRTTARASLKDAFAQADRDHARQDRHSAAGDRDRAAADRLRALSDRSASAGERMAWSYDGLTGLYRRDTGLIELGREIARASRSGTPYVLVYLDVDGLKSRNDSAGHAAGDRLLTKVAETLRSSLRPYDLAVRIGGDEIVCGLPDVSLEEAQQRFRQLGRQLLTMDAAVTYGLAQLVPTDTLQTLIERADAAMYDQRHIDVRDGDEHGAARTS